MPTNKLKPRQENFIAEYLIDFNGAQAVVRAGYKCKDLNVAAAIACENLRKPHIQAALAERQKRVRERLEVRQEDIVEELRSIAFARMTDYMSWGGDVLEQAIFEEIEQLEQRTPEGETDEERTAAYQAGAKQIEKLRHILASIQLIARFRHSEELSHAQAAAIAEFSLTKEGSVKLKLHDKVKSLEMLGKHIGMWPNEQTINIRDLRAQLDEEAEMLQTLLEKYAPDKAEIILTEFSEWLEGPR